MQLGRFSPLALRSLRESTARTNLWHGAVRSGKTVTSILRWLEYVAGEAPPGDLLLIGKTERALKRNILDQIEALIPEDYRLNRGTGEAHIFGRRCYLAGANDERAEGKIRGLTLAGAYGDELTLWPQSIYEMLGTRLSVPGAKFFGTTNPDGPFHWLKTGTIDRAGEIDARCWHFGIDDNPNLDPAFVADLKTRYTGLFYKRFIDGLWVLAEGVVYDGFDLERHGFDDSQAPASFDALRIALDYGTQNPLHALLIGMKSGTSWVLSEYRYAGRDEQRQKTDSEYSDDLREWLGQRRTSVGRWEGGIQPREIVIDPSASSMIAQFKADRWPPVRPADNEVLAGIQTVSNRLSQGKLKIHRTKCPQLVREMGVYSWDPRSAKTGQDKPLKQEDHGPDALRYHEHTIAGSGVPSALDRLKALGRM